MAVYSAFQASASNGDPIKAGIVNQALIDSYESSVIAISDLSVAKFCFYTSLSQTQKTATQSKGTNNYVIAGIVWRSDTQGSYDFYYGGPASVIKSGANAAVITRGTVPVYADNNLLQTPVSPQVNDIVYCGTNGEIITVPSSGGNVPVGAQQTNFRVMYVLTPTVNSLILISNTQFIGI